MKTLIIFAFFYFVAGSNAGPVSDSCNNCQAVVDSVKKHFQNESSEHAFHNFEQVCGQMGNLVNACKNINETLFDKIYKQLESNLLPNEFCFKTGECNSNSIVPIIQAVKSIPTSPSENPECELCKELVNHVVGDLTEDNFHEVLVNGCNQLDSFQSDCKHLADEYYPLLHDYLIDKLNVEAICSFVGICPGPGLFGAPIPVPSVNVIPKVVPTVLPTLKPTSRPVPVSSIVHGHHSPSIFNSPAFNFNPSPAYGLAPFAALPAFAAVPIFAIG